MIMSWALSEKEKEKEKENEREKRKRDSAMHAYHIYLLWGILKEDK